MSRYFLTTAIDYVNSRPHLGTAYEKITAKFLPEGNMLFLYHPQVLIAYSDRLDGYTPMPDGLVRVVGLKLNK